MLTLCCSIPEPVPRNGNRLTPRTTPEATGPELPAPFQQPQIESGESSMQDLPTQVASQAIPRKNGTEVTMAMRRMARKKKLEILAEQKRMEQQELAAAAAREADENTMALTLREENFNSSDQHIDGVIWTPVGLHLFFLLRLTQILGPCHHEQPCTPNHVLPEPEAEDQADQRNLRRASRNHGICLALRWWFPNAGYRLRHPNPSLAALPTYLHRQQLHHG